MKQINKVLLSSFMGATVITGIVAGTTIPILSQQSQTSIANKDSIQNTTIPSTSSANNGVQQANDAVPTTQPTQEATSSSTTTITVPPEDSQPIEDTIGQDNTNTGTNGSNTYSAADYKKFFEAANSNGVISDVYGANTAYKDARDLTKDPSSAAASSVKNLSDNPNSSNYFADYYVPTIPQELSANNIFVIPDSFTVNNGNVIFNYNLQSADRSISVIAHAVVHGFYNYPFFSNNQKVNTKWKPQNLDFLKANLGTNFDRNFFDQFVVDHWNNSLVGDALNAFRYYFLLGANSNTTNLKQYIVKGFYQQGSNWKDRRADWSIGYLMATSYSEPSNRNLAGDLVHIPDWKLAKGADSIFISPVYTSQSSLDTSNKFNLSLKWEIPNFTENNIHNSASGYLGSYLPFTPTGEIKINFKNTKPEIKYDSSAKAYVAKSQGSIQVVVNNHHPHVTSAWKTATVTQTSSFSILDALYQYVKSNGAVATNAQVSVPWFSLFETALTKSV